MDWESSGVVGFDLGPLLEGQMRTTKLKSAYNLLIIGPTGFGALSLRWIQFASVFRCARSSLILILSLQIHFLSLKYSISYTFAQQMLSVLKDSISIVLFYFFYIL